MIFYITTLRALAACLITNSHYTGIYPTDLIANGGLLGDVIFFAVSGYCLFNVKQGFMKWYSKRLVRCYFPVLIITTVYLLLGYYQVGNEGLAWWFIYPTYYHFVASIIILYIPFYFIAKTAALRDKLGYIALSIFIVYLIIYIFVYDKSYYHIDTVREPMIRFLFMESMLLGAWFRKNDSELRNNKSKSPLILIGGGIALVLYFASKTLLAKGVVNGNLQIINQVFLFILLFFIFRIFSMIDKKLTHLPDCIKKVINYVSSVTLEIYVVQYVLIEVFRNSAVFPINWLIVTISILVASFILHTICKYPIKSITCLIERNSDRK